MKDDFHYYLIYALAAKTGWNNDLGNEETEADIIAYASQYVDDNTETQAIGVKEDDLPTVDYDIMKIDEIISKEIQRYQGFPWKVRIGNKGDFFRPIMTQTVSLKSLVPIFQQYVIVPFHFLPGDKEKIPEIRGRKNPYSTTPNSTNSVKILKDAFDSGDIYRIGVALHTFVDTWSHQNFTGYEDDWNRVQKDLRSLIPDVGHAEVMTKPDTISETWTDSRLPMEKQNINNADRAREAVRESFQWLSKYRNARMTWEDVRADFDQLIAAKNTKERIKMVEKMYPDKQFAYKEKEKKTWIKEAVERDKKKAEFFGTQNFFNSHWYKFQLAAKKQLSTVVNMLADII